MYARGRRWQESSIIVRVPEAAKYAVVHAEAATGKLWVDDYSLKQIPSDCEPALFVTPNPVSVPRGRSAALLCRGTTVAVRRVG